MYNGVEPFPDEAVLRLSDLFEKPQDLGLEAKAEPLLQLEVKVININEGRNRDIVNRCKELADYSSFIAKVRSCWNEVGDLETAIKEAIKYCSRHGILKGYLDVYGSEVLNMILTEWNTEDAIAFARNEGREEGREEGWEKGCEKGLLQGREEGRVASNMEIARKALAEGASLEFVQKITGLDLEAVQGLGK